MCGSMKEPLMRIGRSQMRVSSNRSSEMRLHLNLAGTRAIVTLVENYALHNFLGERKLVAGHTAHCYVLWARKVKKVRSTLPFIGIPPRRCLMSDMDDDEKIIRSRAICKFPVVKGWGQCILRKTSDRI